MFAAQSGGGGVALRSLVYPTHHLQTTSTPTAGSSSMFAKKRCVIRVKVPLDIHAVIENRSIVFAIATPLRVGTLVAMAVREVSGLRTPCDKIARSVESTLRGLAAGSFVLNIDGRCYTRSSDVVVCSHTVNIRFFAREIRTRALHRPKLSTK